MSTDAENTAARDLVVAAMTAQLAGDVGEVVKIVRGGEIAPTMVAYWSLSLAAAFVELIAALNAEIDDDHAAPTAQEWWQKYALAWARSNAEPTS